MIRLTIALFIFSLSIHLHSAPVDADCTKLFDTPQSETSNQRLCGQTDGKNATQTKDTAESEILTQIHLSKRKPSLAESLMAMFFIPGLFLLWISRFAKSNK